MDSRWWPRLFFGTGLLLASSLLIHLVIFDQLEPFHLAIDLIIIGGAATGFLYAAYWYASGPATVVQPRTLLGWILGSGALFMGLGAIALYLGSEEVTEPELVEVLHNGAAAGLLAGLLVGTIHLEAIRHAQAAARAEARAEAFLEEQERFDRLNDLLRHYILNAVNVITGYTHLLEEEGTDNHEGAVETIENRARMIATLIEHVQSIQARDVETDASALSDLVDEAVGTGRRTDGLDVHPPDVVPEAMTRGTHLSDAITLLSQVMTDLAGDAGTLTIRCPRRDDGATIAMVVGPARLPESAELALEEPVGSAVGLRVYLAQRLLGADGEIHLREGDDETVTCEILIHSVVSPTDER